MIADENNVYVTWWENNQTSHQPVVRVSNDNGETFGPILALTANGTIEAAEGEGEGGEVEGVAAERTTQVDELQLVVGEGHDFNNI